MIPTLKSLTLAATGSEMDSAGVISNPKLNEKLVFMSSACQPRTSILDSENTFKTPKSQTAAVSVDIMYYVLEVYFSPQNLLIRWHNMR